MTARPYIRIRPIETPEPIIGRADSVQSTKHEWPKTYTEGRDMTAAVVAIWPQAFTNGNLHAMEICERGGRSLVAIYGEEYV